MSIKMHPPLNVLKKRLGWKEEERINNVFCFLFGDIRFAHVATYCK